MKNTIKPVLLSIFLVGAIPKTLGFLPSPRSTAVAEGPSRFSFPSLGRQDDHQKSLKTNNQFDQDRRTKSSAINIFKLRGGHASPPLRSWIFPALSSALSYALYNLSIKKAGSSISPMLGGVILQVVAASLGSILLVFHSRNAVITTSRHGILYSVFAGLFVGAAEILSFQVSATGAQASQSVPVMIGGSVAIGSILGAVLLRERMSLQGWLGVLLVVAGVACVAMDPAANIVVH